MEEHSIGQMLSCNEDKQLKEELLLCCVHRHRQKLLSLLMYQCNLQIQRL